MPKLILRDDISMFNRLQLEAHITAKRMRRMRLALIYAEGQATKLQGKSDVISTKWLKAWDKLKRAIDDANKAEEKILVALNAIGEFEQGYALVETAIKEIEDDLAEDDSDD